MPLHVDSYNDYRKFLSDFYADKKAAKTGFSFRSFCVKAGISSPSMYLEVVAGKRNLSSAMADAFVIGLDLSERDGRFFKNLVLFNQSKSEPEKKKLLAILQGLRYKKPQNIIPVHLYSFYEKWYNPVIRELVVAMEWGDDYRLLAKSVIPAITTAQARKSVKLQLALGFLKKVDSGYKQADPNITTGPEVASLAVRQINRDFAKLGAESIDRFGPAERDVTSLVMGVSSDLIPRLKQEVIDFRKKLIDIVGSQKAVDSVYTLVVELFPVAKKLPQQRRTDA